MKKNDSDFDPVFPPLIDSTIRAAFVQCHRKGFNEFWRNLAPGRSEHLIFGAAFARGLEVTRRLFYGENYKAEDAIAVGVVAAVRAYGNFSPPEKSVKTIENLIIALDKYFIDYPLATDILKPLMEEGRPMVEFSFTFEIPGVNHPVTGDPLLYGGRSDMIAVQEGSGALWVTDEKTTKQMGFGWSGQWGLRGQFFGYAYGAQMYGYPVQGAIIRGICIYKKNPPKTAEAIIYADPWKLERWMHQLIQDTKRMVDCWNTGYWDYNFADACGSYGGCPFRVLCESEQEAPWYSDFDRRAWHPLQKEEDPIDGIVS